jgi:pyruvate kinase
VNAEGQVLSPARIGATLAGFFDCVHPGERVWLDDGKLKKRSMLRKLRVATGFAA